MSTPSKKTPRSESARDLYRPSDSHLSAKLVPTIAVRGCHVVSVTEPYYRNISFLHQSRYFFFQVVAHEAEWSPFRTRYFSESMIAPEIETGPLVLYPGTLTTRPQRRSDTMPNIYSVTSRKVPVRFLMRSLCFSQCIQSVLQHCGRGVDSAYNIKEVKESSWA
jgi:hypothetical protein